MNERHRVMAQLYRWFSIKQQGRWPEIEDEVKSSDFSAKGKTLQLATLRFWMTGIAFFTYWKT
jgi:hypothetical protein